ncbi:serine/threonine protein kinase [Actinomadura craniellae]|uniref:Serine/threonine protein kinase n=1 Tax=Actinomadura craniellae TaxID=2231787 RepID=A0A365GZJ2_9ACTN|nr:serine/threonine-protein kinase [Actinomadura craniellae]RAY12216.1 serine/threonine protein kinase [Actinomadura craniellae]
MEAGALRSGDPERLGPYELVGRLGSGGQGTVFLARNGDRQAAVKLLHAELTADESARARFIREIEVAKRVAPFCTAAIIDADATGDRPYIASEYVPGPSLNKLVQDQGPLTAAALDRLAVGTATALVSIHQADVMHRDFKPHNVLIGPDGPRVIDFGVARAVSGTATVTSRVIGTPAYMAPEQLQGHEVGTAADVFCWAATMVFASCGRPPFGQDTIPAVINRVLHEKPDLGDLQGPLRTLVTDCLAKDPALRPDARRVLMRLLGHDEEPRDRPAAEILTAGSEVAAELTGDATLTRGLSTVTAPEGRPEPRPGGRRSAVLAGIAVLVAALGLAGGLYALSGGGQPLPGGRLGEIADPPAESTGPTPAHRISAPPRARRWPSTSPTPSPGAVRTPMTPWPSAQPSGSAPPVPSDPPSEHPSDPPTGPATGEPSEPAASGSG